MHNKKLKKIMTDLAAGHITQEEADVLLGIEEVVEKTKNTQKRKLNPGRKK